MTPLERLVWLHSTSDANWNVIASPMMADWPRVLLTTVTFESQSRNLAVGLEINNDPLAAIFERQVDDAFEQRAIWGSHRDRTLAARLTTLRCRGRSLQQIVARHAEGCLDDGIALGLRRSKNP